MSDRRGNLLGVFLLLCLASFAADFAAAQQSAAPEDVIWIEGEDATRSDVTRHAWYDSVKKDTLSGNDWLAHFDAAKQGTASFDFDVPQTDQFAFWLRANPVAAELSYRVDEGDWQPIQLAGDLRGKINIANDNKPDLRFVAWLKVGDLQFAAGPHTISFRMSSGPQNHGGIDCFVLTRIPFVPSGAKRPSRPEPATEQSWFPVVLDDDPLSPESIIDVSRLIEAPAGKQGFLQRRADALRFENAVQPTKFWGVNSGPQPNWSPQQMTQAARWYRKHGINLVRQHTVIDAVGLLDHRGEFDAKRLDHYDRWFATLKSEGIYSTWSVIYPHHGRFLQKHDDVSADLYAELDRADEAADGDRQPIAVNDFINLDPSLQEVAWKYFDKLLSHRNPYTGLAYKDDPALAILEFQNESNVFFFTLNVLADSDQLPILSRRMRQGFYRFVINKYTTAEAAQAAWGGRSFAGDNWDAGELRLMGAHHWGSDGPLYEYAGQQTRAGDYIEFLTTLQRDYYARRQRQVRGAGFRGVTVTTAWKSGGPAASMANLYADTAAEMIDRHNYFGGGDGGHRIVEGAVNPQTHLNQPGHGLLSLGLFQVADRPFAVSEWLQMPPNPWKAEAAPLFAFYGIGLQGWDAVYGFAMNSYRMGDGWHNQSKYVVETPHYMGQFPALAMAIYNDHFDQGQVISARSLSRNDVFSGTDVLGQSLAGGEHDAKTLIGRLSTPPAALAVGRVTVQFGAQTQIPQVQLGKFHDQANRRLIATSGQLVWDYGKRRVELRSGKTQGVVGFVDSTAIVLPAARLEIETPFVSLLLTPLDNTELNDSRHILITAMARDKQTGTQYSDDDTRLLQLGGPPLLMQPVQARIRIAGSKPTTVKPCSLYGVPRDETISLDEDGSFEIDGRHQTYYYEVRR